MPPPRLLYLVTEDWYFLSHRLPMARAARAAGYEVHVAARVANGAAAIAAEGFTLHPLRWRRGSLDPFHFLSLARDIRRLYRQVAPALGHHVAFAPSIIGSVAALGLPVQRLNAMAGLGFVFTSRTPKAVAVRILIRWLMRWLMNRPRASVLVQNPDDRTALLSLGVRRDKIALIAGSGVDTGRLRPLPEPPPPVTVGYVGRLLADKGLRTLVKAQALLAQRGEPVRLLIAGEADPANPASIPPQEIDGWRRQPGIALLGHTAVAEVWDKAHIAVLPSRREGLPLSLLEAAACGRPLVATDVPGCREVARDGVNALLVPPDDPEALADAIARLAHDGNLRARFGAAGRALVEDEFSSERIGREIVALYDHLLNRGQPS
jgi:glycosyltransferase involved in cell wall biosynthesis